MTDQGKVFILLGPPYRVSAGAGAPLQSGLGGTGRNVPTDTQGNLALPRPTSDPNQQYWMYAHDKKPKFITQTDFTLVFMDEGRGDWKLAQTERVNVRFEQRE